VNIWLHILGALVSLALISRHAILFSQTASVDQVVLLAYCVCMLVCFACSATMHLFQCTSKANNDFLDKTDFLGVLILLWGSNLPMLYFGFACHVVIRQSLFAVSTTLIVAAAFVVYAPATPKVLAYIIFASVVLYGWTQAVYEVFIHGVTSKRAHLVIICYARAFGCYIIGIILYASKVPERFVAPRKLDLLVRLDILLGTSAPVMRFLLSSAGSQSQLVAHHGMCRCFCALLRVLAV
jgi:adiponectin receptor